MLLHDAGANRQSKSCPSIIPFGREKGIKDLAHACLGDPDSFILDTHHHLTIFLIKKGPNLNTLIACWKGLTGVLNEIDDHLLEALEIPFDGG